jgi:hypothetical protein
MGKGEGKEKERGAKVILIHPSMNDPNPCFIVDISPHMRLQSVL